MCLHLQYLLVTCSKNECYYAFDTGNFFLTPIIVNPEKISSLFEQGMICSPWETVFEKNQLTTTTLLDKFTFSSAMAISSLGLWAEMMVDESFTASAWSRKKLGSKLWNFAKLVSIFKLITLYLVPPPPSNTNAALFIQRKKSLISVLLFLF